MELAISKFLQTVFEPPSVFLLAAFMGVLLLRFNYKWGLRLVVVCISCLYLSATPAIVYTIAGFLETDPLDPQSLTSIRADAIVILAAGRIHDSPEFNRDIPNTYALQRVRYGAWLHKRTGLPLILSGGVLDPSDTYSEAFLMQSVLQEEFGVSVEALEERSRTTQENASYTGQILEQKGYKTVLLVTHALHMPRSKTQFENQGLSIIAAPTIFYSKKDLDFPKLLLPSTKALRVSGFIYHEILGRFWYWLRY